MKILIISSEKRDDFSSTPSLYALALNAMGHNVVVWRNSFFEQFESLVKLNEVNEINEYDVVIATNCGQKILDFSNIKAKKIFLYFEDFDSPILPIGEFNEMWTSKNYLNLLKYCNPLRKEPITTRLIVEPAIAPEMWKPAKSWTKRKWRLAYNGALQDPKDLDPLLHAYMVNRYKYCYELRDRCHKERIGLRLPRTIRNEISEWKRDFRDTQVNIHLSQEFGVGQGAMEAGLNKCALIEYCPRYLAEGFGLFDRKNCLIVETVDETMKAIRYLKKHPLKAKLLGEELYKFALKHTYLKFVPVLSEILESLETK